VSALLRAEAVEHMRGDVRLRIDVLEVERGEVLAILGPNGAGKSTLVRLLGFIERPAAGSVFLDGKRRVPGDAEVRRRVCALFQRPHLFSGTVRSNVAFPLRARGVGGAEADARALRWMNAFGVAGLADADVRRLSGGEAQRAALARAFAADPELLLLDEPAASLDALARRHLIVDLERVVRDDRRGVVLVTHDPAEAFALADRIVLLEAGAIVQAGAPADLVAAPATPFLAALTGAELLLGGRVRARDGRFAIIELDGGALITGYSADDVAPGDPVHAAYRPEDVVLAAPGALEGTSLTNRFRARVGATTPGASGSFLRVRLEGPPALVALVTAASAQGLGIEAGAEVEAALKATAVRVYRGS
jgi:molybdate transport system ATP-binding protein